MTNLLLHWPTDAEPSSSSSALLQGGGAAWDVEFGFETLFFLAAAAVELQFIPRKAFAVHSLDFGLGVGRQTQTSGIHDFRNS